jgi:hypothetical protein
MIEKAVYPWWTAFFYFFIRRPTALSSTRRKQGLCTPKAISRLLWSAEALLRQECDCLSSPQAPFRKGLVGKGDKQGRPAGLKNRSQAVCATKTAAKQLILPGIPGIIIVLVAQGFSPAFFLAISASMACALQTLSIRLGAQPLGTCFLGYQAAGSPLILDC